MLGTKYKTTVSEEFPVISFPAIHSSISTMDSMYRENWLSGKWILDIK